MSHTNTEFYFFIGLVVKTYNGIQLKSYEIAICQRAVLQAIVHCAQSILSLSKKTEFRCPVCDNFNGCNFFQ